MWDSANIPKHAFILWIFVINRLTTCDRLAGKETCKWVLQEYKIECRDYIFAFSVPMLKEYGSKLPGFA